MGHRQRTEGRQPVPRLGTIILCLLVLSIAAAAPAVFAPTAAAQPPAVEGGPGAADAAVELARIRAVLERIAGSLERQAGDQRAELALRRLDVESERALRLERQLADLAADRQSLEDEHVRTRMQLLTMVSDAERPESPYTPEDVVDFREQNDLQVRLLEARMGELDRRMTELQNQLAERREAARGWESVVDRQLQRE
jgi:hypothetical protein